MGLGESPTTAMVRVSRNNALSCSSLGIVLVAPPALRFPAVFGVEMGTLLDPHAMQRHSRRQLIGDEIPDVHCQRFAGCDPCAPARGERGDVLVDVATVEPRHHLTLQ